ncbi:chemotaxis protein CheD [Ornithinibacillus halophilus]|uniref:Probable chemoreceptor glutamine deamidase CheD n=1 Tax=Ornithinibacillus halophilus TaxID=930117 RepID=A0A1M5CBI5_9BACI|nr:chemotaxis protein CheD [Ornithinibacillus halophilus]SHF52123.1 chemotaxis protein CheD [Ornithinibacillus halophilus]
MSNTSQSPIVKVGIADLNIVTPPQIIRTSGLGSCVGVILYDLPKKVAGLAHIMLPDSNHAKQKKFNKGKYADTAIESLLETLGNEYGVRTYSLKAKMAGGAQMFQFSSSNDVMRIGERNVEAVETILKKHKIPIVASDVGGNCGRTIDFDPKTGDLRIRTISKGETII